MDPKIVGKFLDDYILWIITGALVLLWAFMFKLRRRQKKLPNARDVIMTVEGRRLLVQRTVLDKVCDGILDAYLDGDITTEEANAELARIAKFYHHEEIIPLINDKKSKLLKHRLKKLKRQRSLNGGAPALPIPNEPKKAKPKNDGELLASILNS